jgi:hypothetical protein
MSSRRSPGFLVSLAIVLAFLAACSAGSPPQATGDAANPSASGDTPAQAANDPANPAPTTAGETAKEDAYDPATAAGAVKGVPAPTNTMQIEAVANYFTELPGFDLAPLSTHQREKFLHRVNSEVCTCGCKNDTLAKCLVNDPKCPAVKGMVQTVYDEIKSGS